MPAITLTLTDEMAAFVREEAAHGGYPDIESYLQALVMNRHEARMARLRDLMEASDAASIEALREETRRRYRERGV